MADKLYLITRADLPAGQQAVQAAHAAIQFGEEFPSIHQNWFKTSNTLALLTAKDEQALGVIYRRAMDRDIPAAPFHEPDRGGEMTAIALGPQGRQLTKNLPLALQEKN